MSESASPTPPVGYKASPASEVEVLLEQIEEIEEERRTSNLELFFDLVFVFAITQIAALLRRNPDMARVPVTADEIGGLTDCVSEIGDVRILPCNMPHEDPRLAGLDGFFASRLMRKMR